MQLLRSSVHEQVVKWIVNVRFKTEKVVEKRGVQWKKRRLVAVRRKSINNGQIRNIEI